LSFYLLSLRHRLIIDLSERLKKKFRSYFDKVPADILLWVLKSYYL
jgi:hypothetical protein